MWDYIVFKWRCWRRQNFVEVTESSAGTYVNAYGYGECIDSEIFWKSDFIDQDGLDKWVDTYVDKFKKEYEIKKVIDGRNEIQEV